MPLKISLLYLKKTKPKQKAQLKFFKHHVNHSRGQPVTWMKVAHCLLLSQSKVCPLDLCNNWLDSDWSNAQAKAAFFTLILCQDLLPVVTWTLDCYPPKEAETVHLPCSSFLAGLYGTHTTACPLFPNCRAPEGRAELSWWPRFSVCSSRGLGGMPEGSLAGPQVQAQCISFRWGGCVWGKANETNTGVDRICGLWFFTLRHHFMLVILLY